MRTYDVHGLYLGVEFTPVSLQGHAELVLAPFAANTSKDGSHRIQISYGLVVDNPDDLPEAKARWEGQLPNGIKYVSSLDGGFRRLNLLGLAQIDFALDMPKAGITISKGSEHCLARNCIVPVLCDFLARAGQFFVHAACLQFEINGRARAILLSGASGTGKTTTSLALAGSGMKLQSDDASIIKCDGRNPNAKMSVWGLMAGCKVHKNTRQLLPWINDLKSRPAITPDEDLIEIPSKPGRSFRTEAEPAAIFFLEQRNGQDHSIKPLKSREALSRLVSENIRSVSPEHYQIQGARFRAISKLVTKSQCYSLSVGPQIETLGEQIRDLLGAG